MSGLFQVAAELMLTRSSEALFNELTEKIKSELLIKKVFVLTLNSEGRLLEYKLGQTILTWSVTDFNSPIAHVIQSNSEMSLKSEEVYYWQSDHALNQLCGKLNDKDKIAIIPMSANGKSSRSLLVLVGKETQLNKVNTNKDFYHLISVCANHFQLLLKAQESALSSSLLSESLKEIEKGAQTHSIIKTLIGNSDLMAKLKGQISNAASSALSVMILGDTGTGKELASRAVHDLSERHKGAFVAINCAAIPENLLESELFGYVKGAFSGAERDKQGLLAEADGGTLFLDEIGDIPLALQAKLLRVLESYKYRPVGEKKELHSNFRLVTATHVDLKQKVIDKLFRKDLYYRIYQYPLVLPNLSARKGDIEMLSNYFIRQYNKLCQRHIIGLDNETLNALLKYDFPGNVRELKHIIEYGCAQTKDSKSISLDSIFHRLEIDQGVVESKLNERDIACVDDLKEAMRLHETSIITARLQDFNGDKTKVAESLGMPKRTLTDKCKKLEIFTCDESNSSF